MTRRLWDVKTVADMTGWSEFTVRRHARQGRIPAKRIAGRIYFIPAEVEKWLAALPSAK
jgi:excisionase family DNA binding protein